MKIGDVKLNEDEEKYVNSWIQGKLVALAYELRTQINKPFSEYEFIEWLGKQCQNNVPEKEAPRQPDPKTSEPPVKPKKTRFEI